MSTSTMPFSIKSLLTLLFLLTISVLISGCQSTNQATGNQYEVDESGSNTSVIYLYRPNTGHKGKALEYPEVFIDGLSLGVMKVRGYMMKEVPAGKHEIRITGATNKADWSFREIKRTINVKSESKNYFRLMVRFDMDSNELLGLMMEHLVFLTPVEPDEAIREMKGTFLSE
ncbi:MAG: DUF2846 domain-containing protein [Porticoccus sp.]